MTMPSKNFDLAMSAAAQLAGESPSDVGLPPARRIQICNDIDGWVGAFVWCRGKHRMSWPLAIAARAKMPERHLTADNSPPAEGSRG